MKNKEVLKILAETNDPKYNLTKAVEELCELSTALAQRINKGDHVKDPEIQIEIADVEIRLKVLKHLYGHKECNAFRDKKLERYNGYIKDKKYIGRI